MKLKKVLSIIFFIFLLVIFCNTKAYANDNNRKAFEDLIINDIIVSNATPEIDSYVTYTINFSTSEEINRIDMNINNPNSYGNRQMMEINGNTATVTFKMDFFGLWIIDALNFQNTDGEELNVINTISSNWYGENTVYTDLSKGNVYIENKLNDVSGPNVDILSMKMEKTNLLVNERNIFSVNVTDDSGISMVDMLITFPDGSACGFYPTSIEGDKYIFDYLGADLIGKYKIEFIRCKDRNGNETIIADNNSSYIDDESVIKVDLSYLNFTVKTEQKEEKNAPKIIIESFKVNKNRLERNEFIEWTFEIEDESDIELIEVHYQNGKARNGLYGNYGIKNNEGKYVITSTADLYGKYKIAYIKVVDIWGNKTILKNSDYKKDEYFIGEVDIRANLKSIDADVGIFDKKEGIFVTGEDMENDVKIDVEKKEHHGKDYDKLHHKGHDVHDFFEINAEGSYNKYGNKVKVEFECGSENNGKKCRISHLLSNGQVQEQEQIIENGKAYILVDEFSPFMIQIASSNVDNEESDKETNTDIELDKEIDVNQGSSVTKPNINNGSNTNNQKNDSSINNVPQSNNSNNVLQYSNINNINTSKPYNNKLVDNKILEKELYEENKDEFIEEDVVEDTLVEKNVSEIDEKENHLSEDIVNLKEDKKYSRLIIFIFVLSVIIIAIVIYIKIVKK